MIPKKVFTTAPEWDEAAFMAAHQEPPPVSIRYNPHKFDISKLEIERVPWSAYGCYLNERPQFTLDPLFHAGAYYVQEASSMLIEQAFKQYAQASTPLSVLDLCAAPGGKSTLLASLLKAEDFLLSNEVIQHRSNILVENLTRWGQLNTWVSNNDPKDIGKLSAFFDLMLIDAPCSGSGLWRKDPKAIDEWSTAHVRLCMERQQRIIHDALPALKPGGILIYATCSYSPEENEQMLDWMLDMYPLESLSLPLAPDWSVTETQSAKHRAFGYRCYPWKLKGEGFFMAVLQKRADAEGEAIKLTGKKHKHTAPAKGAKERFAAYLDTDFALLHNNDTFYALVPRHEDYWELLKSKLYIKKAGTALGQLQKEVIPDHALALSIFLSKEIDRANLSRDEALQFLKKESVTIDQGWKGWRVASYEGLGLGWGKWLGNRMNNYFPKQYRIRMDISQN